MKKKKKSFFILFRYVFAANTNGKKDVGISTANLIQNIEYIMTRDLFLKKISTPLIPKLAEEAFQIKTCLRAL